MQILWRSQPIEQIVQAPATPPALRRKLALVMEIRRFASAELALPDNDSYTEYADLERAYVVWNVFAAPELSLEPRQWCFPIVGCVAYRGYFDEAGARAFARELRADGDDVFVGGVPAYSTLGWFDDPILNTFVDYPESELAGLVFHELAHQVVYVKDDTTFNESFATAVELAGVRRWHAARETPLQALRYAQRQARHQQLIDLLLATRERLGRVYRSSETDARKRARKAELIAELRADFAALVAAESDYESFARWFAQPINNARLASVAAYFDLVPAFLALLERHDGDFAAFYTTVKQLADAHTPQRRARLMELSKR